MDNVKNIQERIEKAKESLKKQLESKLVVEKETAPVGVEAALMSSETETEEPTETIEFIIPKFRISDMWGRPGDDRNIDRKMIERIFSQIRGDTWIERIKSVNDFFTACAEGAECPTDMSMEGILANLVFLESLSTIVYDFNDQTGGFLLEDFLPPLVGGESARQIPVGAENVADFEAEDDAGQLTGYSLKFFIDDANKKIDGSRTGMFADLLRYGRPLFYIIALKEKRSEADYVFKINFHLISYGIHDPEDLKTEFLNMKGKSGRSVADIAGEARTNIKKNIEDPMKKAIKNEVFTAALRNQPEILGRLEFFTASGKGEGQSPEDYIVRQTRTEGGQKRFYLYNKDNLEEAVYTGVIRDLNNIVNAQFASKSGEIEAKVNQTVERVLTKMTGGKTPTGLWKMLKSGEEVPAAFKGDFDYKRIDGKSAPHVTTADIKALREPIVSLSFGSPEDIQELANRYANTMGSEFNEIAVPLFNNLAGLSRNLNLVFSPQETEGKTAQESKNDAVDDARENIRQLATHADKLKEVGEEVEMNESSQMPKKQNNPVKVTPLDLHEIIIEETYGVLEEQGVITEQFEACDRPYTIGNIMTSAAIMRVMDDEVERRKEVRRLETDPALQRYVKRGMALAPKFLKLGFQVFGGPVAGAVTATDLAKEGAGLLAQMFGMANKVETEAPGPVHDLLAMFCVDLETLDVIEDKFQKAYIQQSDIVELLQKYISENDYSTKLPDITDHLVDWLNTKSSYADSEFTKIQNLKEEDEVNELFGFGKKKQKSGATPEEIIDGIKVKDLKPSRHGKGVDLHLHYLPSDREFKFKASESWNGFPQLEKGALQILKPWEGMSNYNQALIAVVIASEIIQELVKTGDVDEYEKVDYQDKLFDIIIQLPDSHPLGQATRSME